MPVKRTFVRYFCKGICQASKKHKTATAGTEVYLLADGVSVKLDFHKKSPFVSGHKKISIPANTFKKEVIKAVLVRTDFPYSLTCGPKCRLLFDEPSMVVEL